MSLPSQDVIEGQSIETSWFKSFVGIGLSLATLVGGIFLLQAEERMYRRMAMLAILVSPVLLLLFLSRILGMQRIVIGRNEFHEIVRSRIHLRIPYANILELFLTKIGDDEVIAIKLLDANDSETIYPKSSAEAMKEIYPEGKWDFYFAPEGYVKSHRDIFNLFSEAVEGFRSGIG